jgi:hypothetical protein
MQLFQIFVILISISIFIGLFIYTATIYYRGSKSKQYPPDLSSCPDYWKIMKREIDGDVRHVCQIPSINELNLGGLKEKGLPLYKYSNIDGNIHNNISFLPSYYDFHNNNTDSNSDLSSYIPEGYSLPNLRYYSTDDIPNGYGNAYNNYNLNKFEQNNYIDFQDSGWASHGDPYCQIKNWAKINNIQWDGISNYNNC